MRWLVGAFVGLALVLAGGPASADSWTWGYGFARDRTTAAPVSAEAPAAPQLDPEAARPFVVPLPGRSQSTPVVVGGTWYQWTYWDGGRRGALWSGRLTAGPAASTSGGPLTLPGQSGPVIAAGPGERFDEPADAAVSPDGRWVAFGVGTALYWWPAADPGAGARAQITGVAGTVVAANSTSPTFVPDPSVKSGWDVCDGNWNGGFSCFEVATGDGFEPLPTARYLASATTPADADGYAAITSSAAYGGPEGLVYFGVASAYDPRVMALDPRTGAFSALNGGRGVAAPVWAAVALEGDSVYATDVEGTPYRFSATGGRLLATAPQAGGTTDIVSPAVDAGYLYVLVNGAHTILRLDRRTLRIVDAASAGGAASALTVVPHADSPEIFYAAEDGGVDVAVPTPPVHGAPGTIGTIAAWPGAPAGGVYNWTAAVVDAPDVLLWSDGASAAWQGVPGARQAAGPVGFGATAGGIQIYRLRPRLTAFIAPTPAVVGHGSVTLTVLAAPGAVISAAGTPWGRIDLAPAPPGADPCPRTAGGAGVGFFPQAGAPTPAPSGGCGPWSTAAAALDRLAASTPATQYPDFAGLAPAQWQAAGAGYVARQASLTIPISTGEFAVSVTAAMPDGSVSAERVWLRTVCPAGWGEAANGACTIDLRAPVNPWTSTGQPPPAGDRCAQSVAPGSAGMTPREFTWLCRPVASWLTNGAVLACYGTWWNAVDRRSAPMACGASGHGR